MNGFLVNLAFVILVSTPAEEKQANILISSIREFGGIYADCPVYIFMSDTLIAPCHSIRYHNVKKIFLSVNNDLPDYPFLHKVLACAEAEELLKDKSEFMVWMDTDALVLKEPSEFYPGNKKKLAIRPVFLRNNVGLPVNESPDLYWKRIFDLTALKVGRVPEVETIVDTVKIRSYYNCAVFAIRPGLGALCEWKNIFLMLINDQEYQEKACTTENKKIFLHQAVLSAVISSRVRENQIKYFSMKAGYPLHHHFQLSHEKRATCLDQIESLIYDNLWGVPNWILCTIHADAALKMWLQEEYEKNTGKGLFVL